MIDSIGSIQSSSLMNAVREMTQTSESMMTNAASKLGGADKASDTKAPSFAKMIGELVEQVNTKQAASAAEAEKVFTGQSDNIHQAMLSMQEAGVAFTLMTEVRNKLVSSYQELMRMQV